VESAVAGSGSTTETENARVSSVGVPYNSH